MNDSCSTSLTIEVDLRTTAILTYRERISYPCHRLCPRSWLGKIGVLKGWKISQRSNLNKKGTRNTLMNCLKTQVAEKASIIASQQIWKSRVVARPSSSSRRGKMEASMTSIRSLGPLTGATASVQSSNSYNRHISRSNCPTTCLKMRESIRKSTNTSLLRISGTGCSRRGSGRRQPYFRPLKAQ